MCTEKSNTRVHVHVLSKWLSSLYLTHVLYIWTQEQEGAQLMESYQTLVKEAERLEYTIQQTKSQHSSLDIEINTLKQENNQLRELCQQQANEISQV